MIEQLTNIARIILFILIVIIALGLLIMVYFKKYKRKNKAVEYDDIDYSSYDRKDSVDLCKFEDIVDDMIITDNGTRFVGIIKVRGFDIFMLVRRKKTGQRLVMLHLLYDKRTDGVQTVYKGC